MRRLIPFFQRNRVFLTRLFAVPYFGAVLFSQPATFEDAFHEGMEIFGYALIVIATIGRIWCAVYIAGRKNREICRLGPYSLCRNPLYLFSFLGLVGVTLGAENLLLAILVSPLYWIYYALVIAAEEAELRARFAEDFGAYCRSVPRIIPL